MTLLLPHIRQAITSRPWAILPERASDIVAVIERRAMGLRLSSEQIAAIKGPREQPNGMARFYTSVDGRVLAVGGVLAFDQDEEDASTDRRPRPPAPLFATQGAGNSAGGAVAVINVFGIIAQHARQVDDVSGPGGTSCERVKQSISMAVAEPGIKGVILNVDSPGGSAGGVQELTDYIYSLRGSKPIVAVCNSMMASAAYWIACSCDEIVVAPGGLAGNIGAYILHEDVSKAAEGAGLKYTFISAGKYKVEGNQFEPLTDEARGSLQASVDSYYLDFVKAVARGRGDKPANVMNGYGEGRVLKDNEAVRANVADRVGTLDNTISRMISGKGGTKGKPKAQAESFTMRRHQHSENKDDFSVSIESPFPEVLASHDDVLLAGHQNRFLTVFGDPHTPGTRLLFTFANAQAEYEVEHTEQDDSVGRAYTYATLCWQKTIDAKAPVPVEPGNDTPVEPPEASSDDLSPAVLPIAGDDGDDFRRRRHAHRLRRS